MNYEERYNKALERAKKMLASKRSVIVKRQALETIFPELKESEDERIRKGILNYLVSRGLSHDWIAWLEKQGEQNLANSAKICKEDEEMFDMTEINLRELRDRFGEKYGRVGDCIAWLKSLKERFGCEVNCTTKKNEE